MADRFTFYGRLKMSKPTEKFQPYSVMTSKKGWEIKNLRLNCVTESGVQFLNSTGYRLPDNSNILKFNDRKDNKPVEIKIPFTERLSQESINKVPYGQRFSVDLEEDLSSRQAISNLIRRFNNNIEEIPNDEITQLGYESKEAMKKAYEDSRNKKREFITQWDFIEYIKKMIDSKKFDDTIFKISGSIEVNHATNGNDYLSYVPKKIVIAQGEVTDPAKAMVDIYFDKDAISETEDGLELNGFIQYWDRFQKRNQYASYPIVLPLDGTEEANARKKSIYKKIFNVPNSGDVKYLGVEVDMLNGAPKKQIRLEDLDESTRELVELGIISKEDALRDSGTNYRSREIIKCNVFRKIQREWASNPVAQDASIRSDELGYVVPDTFMEELPF